MVRATQESKLQADLVFIIQSAKTILFVKLFIFVLYYNKRQGQTFIVDFKPIGGQKIAINFNN